MVSASDKPKINSAGFWLPDGSVTHECHLQKSKPVYFNGNQEFPLSYFLDLYKNVTAVPGYNFCGAKVPLCHNKLNINVWRESLLDYHDAQLVDFLEFGWPLGIDPSIPMKSTLKNHPSSFQFATEMDQFIVKQLSLIHI